MARTMLLALLLVACSGAEEEPQGHVECEDLTGLIGGCGGVSYEHCMRYDGEQATPVAGFLIHHHDDGTVAKRWKCKGVTCSDQFEAAMCWCFEREGDGLDEYVCE